MSRASHLACTWPEGSVVECVTDAMRVRHTVAGLTSPRACRNGNFCVISENCNGAYVVRIPVGDCTRGWWWGEASMGLFRGGQLRISV